MTGPPGPRERRSVGRSADSDALLEGQRRYYDARAAEYDEWFLRRGRYDRGPELNARWFDETAELARRLEAVGPRGRILELACGTGLWTERLARHADRLTAVDASLEMLEINRRRPGNSDVRFVQADLFAWEPDACFDFVFFAFWLSHVPPERFDAFWTTVSRALAPGGRVFLVDSLYQPTSTAVDHRLGEPTDTVVTRALNDGRHFEVVKVFYRPAELQERLRAVGWSFEVGATATYFLYGSGEPTA
jgi:demethylmenaquinone methyltransferase/2-methoxy-6-polyprenyl-1,4-benzoquinol methylase